jgi:Transposase DDE domain group 1
VKNSARSSKVTVSADGQGLVSQAGAVLLWETLRVTGLGRGLSAALEPWRAPRAVHHPGKIVADLAAALALGGDCLADIAVLRGQPALAGPVASDPVVSRLVKTLAADEPAALAAIRAARAAARGAGLGAGRRCRARRRRRPGHHRPGRDHRDRALREGTGLPRPGRRPSAC